MPFILNEDEALKSILSGITVSDAGNSARPVSVFYGQPDPQIRQQSYPYITIDLVGVSEAKERTHSGYSQLTYVPEDVDPNQTYFVMTPIPVNLDYQITTFARQPRHDRQIIAQLFKRDRLPLRFGYLEVPQDNTVRRLDMLGFSKRDITEQDKRLFSNVYSIQVSSELLRDDLAQVYEVLYPPTITLDVSQNAPITQPH